jgi:hypothetical protein
MGLYTHDGINDPQFLKVTLIFAFLPNGQSVCDWWSKICGRISADGTQY